MVSSTPCSCKMSNQRICNKLKDVDRPSRPPNGFLMFCQGHRDIVSYNNNAMQNRDVTKMLGVWWSELGPAEKMPFQVQAQKYREQVYKSFPSFRWHTPRQAGNQIAPVTRNTKRNNFFTPGKLADESQMGRGLSGLMVTTAAKQCNNNNEDSRCSVDGCTMSADHGEHASQLQTTDKSGSVKRKQSHPQKLEPNAKRRSGHPVIQPSTSESPISLCYKRYAEKCPTYSYEDFLKRREESKRSPKKSGKKRKMKKGSRGGEGSRTTEPQSPQNYFSLLLLAIEVVEAQEAETKAEQKAVSTELCDS